VKRGLFVVVVVKSSFLQQRIHPFLLCWVDSFSWPKAVGTGKLDSSVEGCWGCRLLATKPGYVVLVCKNGASGNELTALQVGM
jgi:hypothetical protein